MRARGNPKGVDSDASANAETAAGRHNRRAAQVHAARCIGWVGEIRDRRANRFGGSTKRCGFGQQDAQASFESARAGAEPVGWKETPPDSETRKRCPIRRQSHPRNQARPNPDLNVPRPLRRPRLARLKATVVGPDHPSGDGSRDPSLGAEQTQGPCASTGLVLFGPPVPRGRSRLRPFP